MEGIPAEVKQNGIIKHIEFLALPVALVFLFILQNYFFNVWLNIYSGAYFLRLLAATLALGVILYGPSLLFEKHLRYVWLLVASILIAVISSAQFLYFKYADAFLQFSALRYLGQAGSVSGTIKSMLTPELLLFCAGPALVLTAYLLIFRKSFSDVNLSVISKLIIFIVIAAITFSGYNYLLYSEKKEWGSTSRLYKDVYDLNALVGKIGIVNFALEDTLKYALRSNLVTQNDKSFLAGFAKTLLTGENAAPAKYFGSEKGKNVIIIQVESLENAVINQTIAGQEITPNLNALAAQGLYFPNYYTQVGPGNTADAEFSTMDSLYPLPDDVVFTDYAQNNYNALPFLLKKNGYGTYSLHGDVATFWNRANIYPRLGYQKAFDLDDYIVTRPVGNGPSDLGDEDLFLQSLPKLENLKQPFLATVITMSSHTPFTLPDDLQTLQIPGDTTLNSTQQQYLQSIHYSDKAIGEFIDGLKKDGLYNNSLILIWGDHGSFTNINQALGGNKISLPELENSQVPLIILSPGKYFFANTNEPGSHLDIFPTIANLLGVVPPKTILGQDLLNTKTPVETHFKLVSGEIDAILTSSMAFEAGEDGQFLNGSCISIPYKNPLPLNNCQSLYKQQADTLKSSDIIVRGNLLNTFLADLTQPLIIRKK